MFDWTFMETKFYINIAADNDMVTLETKVSAAMILV